MGAMGGGLSLGTLSITIAAAVDQALSEIQRFGSEVSGIIEDQKTKWDGLAKVGDGMVNVGAALTAGVTLPLLGIGAAAVTVSEQLNAARVGFTTMLGSGEAASKMLGDLQKFAATTPFEFPDLVKSAQRMMALGFSADQVIPTLRTVGDTAAGMGQGKEAIDGITLALGQMQSKGKVSAQEMNQLAERGIPAWQILADAIGVSIPEAMKLAEKGAIQASDAVPALLGGMNDKFAGNMDQMSKTLTGQWSNFKDTIGQALIPIGEALTPALTGLVQLLMPVIEGIKDLANWFKELPTPVQNAALAFAAIVAVAGPIILGLGGIITAVTTLGPAIAGIAGALGLASSAALIPFAAAIAGVVAALVLIGTWVYQNWAGIVAALGSVWAGIQTAWEGFSGWVSGWWNAIWAGVLTVWHSVMDPFFSILTTLWDAYTSVWGAVWTAITGALQTAWDAIVGAWHFVMDPFFSILATIWDAYTTAWGAIWTAITGALQTAWGAIIGAWNAVMGPFVGGLGTIWDGPKRAAEAAWAAITGAIGKALDLVAKLPGVSGIINGFKQAIDGGAKANADLEKALDKSVTQVGNAGKAFTDANQKAKDLKEQTEKVTKATDDHGKVVVTVKGGQEKLTQAQKDAAKAAKDCAGEFKLLIEKNDVLYAIAGKLAGEHDKLAKYIAAAKVSGHDITKEFGDGMAPALERVNAETGLLITKFDTLTGTNGLPKVLSNIGQVKLLMDPATGSIAGMNAGLETLGITSAAKFTQIATDAKTAYDKVIAAPDATKWEKDSAFLKLLEAERQKMIANGTEIPALMDKQMADLKASVENKAPDVKGAFDGMANSVSTVITNFAQDISKALWDGDLSWGEKGKELLKSLGQAVTSSFIEPAAKAIGDFIGGAIKDLLSGKGLGGVLSTLGEIGSKAKDVFSETPAAGGVPSTGAPGGGTGGAGAAVGAGLSGWIGAISGAVTAISSVIGNFQMAGMNKSLDIIVQHTLQTANDLFNLRRDDWDRHNEYAKWKDDIVSALWGIQGNTGTAIASLQAIELHCYNASATLADMLTDSRSTGPAASSFMDHVVELLGKAVYKLDALAAGSNMTMNLNGTDPTTVASRLATQIRLQGGRA